MGMKKLIIILIILILLTCGCTNESSEREDDDNGDIQDDINGDTSGEGDTGGEYENPTGQGGITGNASSDGNGDHSYIDPYDYVSDWDEIAEWDINDTTGPYTNNLVYPPIFNDTPFNISTTLVNWFNCTVNTSDSYWEDENVYIYRYNLTNGGAARLAYIDGFLVSMWIHIWRNDDSYYLIQLPSNDTGYLKNYSNQKLKEMGFDISSMYTDMSVVNGVPHSYFEWSLEYFHVYKFNDDISFKIQFTGTHFSFNGKYGNLIGFSSSGILSNLMNITPYISIHTARDIAQNFTDTNLTYYFSSIQVRNRHLCYRLDTFIETEDSKSNHDVIWIDVQTGEVHEYFQHDY